MRGVGRSSFLESCGRLNRGVQQAALGVALGLAGAQAAAAPATDEPPIPGGEPPAVAASAPGWEEQDRPASDFASNGDALSSAAPRARRPRVRSWLGAQNLFVEDKVMPGLTWRVGYRVVWLDLEGSFVWLTRESPTLGTSFLGNHIGAHVMLAPLRVGGVLLRAGLGGDFYPLWNVHGDEWQAALTLRASAHVPLTKRVNVFGTARAYLVESDGVELGVDRQGGSRMPVLFSLGLEWRS